MLLLSSGSQLHTFDGQLRTRLGPGRGVDEAVPRPNLELRPTFRPGDAL